MMLILIESEVWHIQKLPGPPAIFLYSGYSYTVDILIQWIFLYSGYSYTVDILIQWILYSGYSYTEYSYMEVLLSIGFRPSLLIGKKITQLIHWGMVGGRSSDSFPTV